MNFALASDQTREFGLTFNLIACTLDAQWDNKCEVHPITYILELKTFYMDTEFLFDLTGGMCAH